MTAAFFNRPALEAIHKACLDLGARKSADYGQVGDAIAMAGIPGIATRLLDKQFRISSLTQKGYKPLVQDESLRDTLMDMVNYATYGIALLDGTWGNSEVTVEESPQPGVKDSYAWAKDQSRKVQDIR